MNTNSFSFRNGTTQKDRYPAALEIDFVSIEERGPKDMIEFAGRLAKQLKFYNENNAVDGDWSKMFAPGADEIMAYLTKPESFAVDPDASAEIRHKQRERLERLSRPHLTLFLAFLRLLRHQKREFDDLTRRHLDFYYKQVLKLDKRKAVPDRVFLVFKPSTGMDVHPLMKGTLVKAGQDGQGGDLFYALEDHIMVNRALVTSVKTFSPVQRYISLYDMCVNEENGFDVMLRWALGKGFRGDELPRYPGGGANPSDVPMDAGDLLKEYGSANGVDNDYVLDHLCFLNESAFNCCMDVYKTARSSSDDFPSKEKWLEATSHVEKAFAIRDRRDRQKKLENVCKDKASGFDEMMRYALGEPRPGDDLPPMPGVDDTLDKLYEAVKSKPAVSATDKIKTDFALAARYVSESLCISIDDFKKIIEIKRKSSSAQSSTNAEWESVYEIVEQAQSLKQNYKTPPAGRWKSVNMIPTLVGDAASGSPLTVSRFEAFGKTTQEAKPDLYFGPGIAIASPLLLLTSGKRKITLGIACGDEDFSGSEIQALTKQPDPVFDLFLSGEKDWIHVEPECVCFEAGDVLSGGALESYETDEIDLVCDVSGADAHTDFILFEDGSLWSATQDNNRFRLTFKTKLSGPWSNRALSGLTLEGTPVSLDGLEYLEERNEITAEGSLRGGAEYYAGPKTEEREYFFERDKGRFIVWEDGGIFSIEEVMSSGRIRVEFKGKLPGYNAEVPKKYDQIGFANSSHAGEISITGMAVSDTSERYFSDDDVGRLFVMENGQVFKIESIQEKSEMKEAKVASTGTKAPSSDGIKKYDSFNGLHFTITLDKDAPAVVPVGAYAEPLNGYTSHPVMKLRLRNNRVSEYGDERIENAYEHFESIRLQSAKLMVNVKECDDFKLANDGSTLNPQKPFEPFGSTPKAGASLYFSSKELAWKKLDSMEVRFAWMGLPKSFERHYRAYSKCGLPDIPQINERSFQARLSLLNGRSWMDIEYPKPLFVADGDDASSYTLYFREGFKRSNYKTSEKASSTDSNDPSEYGRYFKLELENPDFQHDVYSLVLNRIALDPSNNQAGVSNKPTVYPPYTPKAKNMSIHYTASAIIKPSLEETGGVHRMLHIHPFGYIAANDTIDSEEPNKGAVLFPQYKDHGYLFVGLENAFPSQVVALLFQLIPGTGDPDVKPPDVTWSYLTQKGWKEFGPVDILSDATNSLIDSGVIKFRIPDDAFDQCPLMPTGSHWIRARAGENAQSTPDIVGIHAQAAKAIFMDRNNAADHLKKPLPSMSANELSPRDSAIQSVSQPYPSFGGRMVEEDRPFYNRVSERLRHKERAVAPWDYERLILDEFPEMYQAKCLFRSEQTTGYPGCVEAVVVPDMSNSYPFLPLEPKAPVSILTAIQKYLAKRASPGVKIKVNNPVYERITYRVAVYFKEGFGRGHYQKELGEDIKRFLSPWAYDSDISVTMGGVVHTSALIYYLENKNYVDYVANVKLFEENVLYQGTDNEETRWKINDSGIAKTDRPGAILVSGDRHYVDIITTKTYREEDFVGVGYMVVGLDFFIK